MRLPGPQTRVNSWVIGRKIGASRYSGAAGSRQPALSGRPRYERFGCPRAPVNSCAASPRKEVKFERFGIVDMLRLVCPNFAQPRRCLGRSRVWDNCAAFQEGGFVRRKGELSPLAIGVPFPRRPLTCVLLASRVNRLL
jgi:hypothetical protein